MKLEFYNKSKLYFRFFEANTWLCPHLVNRLLVYISPYANSVLVLNAVIIIRLEICEYSSVSRLSHRTNSFCIQIMICL